MTSTKPVPPKKTTTTKQTDCATSARGLTMMIKEVRPQWWQLVSEADDQVTLTFFGYSKAEVVGKFRKWVREYDMVKLRRMGR